MRIPLKRLPPKPKALSASCVSGLLCALLLWSPSCSTPLLTEIIVTVDSTFPEGELDTIRLIIVRDGESRAVTADLTNVGLPFTQGVVHRGGSFDVSISAQGISQDRVIVEQLIPIERFIEGETLQVRVELSRRCIDVMCGAGTTCMEGICVSTSTDAGVADAGTSDGGMNDIGLFDAQPIVDALADRALDVDQLGECPSGTIAIVGDYICAADCPECSLRCDEGDCHVTCLSGATCRVESDAHNVDANCEEGSNCSLRSTDQGGVTAQCARSTCEVECNGAGPCNTRCARGNCGVICSEITNCELLGCAREECLGNHLVCGRECP
ncbi:MAG: hypothetical protein ACI9KE_005614 [Polyangiales bacterium]|jgi:hypothetical protein